MKKERIHKHRYSQWFGQERIERHTNTNTHTQRKTTKRNEMNSKQKHQMLSGAQPNW